MPLAVERDKPLWPRNEDDIDLPTDPPPRRAPVEALDEPIYLGVVRARLRHQHDPMDIEVRLPLDLTGVELGPLTLDADQARRLWRLLRVALGVLAPIADRAPALARNAAGLTAAGCPWEGETLP